MKKHITLILTILIATTNMAQNGINYKAIIKDNSGNIIANDLIQVQFSILQGTAQTNVYEETHSQSTDINGAIILNIGEGTVISGDFATIDWASDDHYLNVKINTGTGLVNMGTTVFSAVPYAMQAENAKNALTAIDAINVASHNHLEETWTGASDESLTINGNTSGGVITVSNSGLGSGIEIESSALDGISIQNPGYIGVRINNPEYRGMTVGSASNDGVHVTFAGNNGGFFQGGTSGVHAVSSTSANPDVILGGGGSGGIFDDGIIASDPDRPASDIYLRSYDAVVVQLDYNNDEDGEFEIRAGNGTNVFELYETGLAVIGNGSTTSKLIIDGDSDASLSSGTSGLLQVGSSFGDNILMDRNEIMAKDNGVTAPLYLQFEGGYVSIGDVPGAPNVALDVAGSIQYTGTITQSSDERLKENFKSINNALKKLQSITGYSYNMIDDEDKQSEYGVKAQDVQKVFPEMVSIVDPENQYLGVSYTQLIPVLIEAIKEQQIIINKQASHNKEQQLTMSAMLERVEKLEALNNQ